MARKINDNYWRATGMPLLHFTTKMGRKQLEELIHHHECGNVFIAGKGRKTIIAWRLGLIRFAQNDGGVSPYALFETTLDNFSWVLFGEYGNAKKASVIIFRWLHNWKTRRFADEIRVPKPKPQKADDREALKWLGIL